MKLQYLATIFKETAAAKKPNTNPIPIQGNGSGAYGVHRTLAFITAKVATPTAYGSIACIGK